MDMQNYKGCFTSMSHHFRKKSAFDPETTRNRKKTFLYRIHTTMANLKKSMYFLDEVINGVIPQLP